MFQKNAGCATPHLLTREYGRRLLELASLHHRKLFTADEKDRLKPPYRDGGLREWRESETTREEVHGLESPFFMDFENYTLGRLVPGRGNYDYQHPEYQKFELKYSGESNSLGGQPPRSRTLTGKSHATIHMAARPRKGRKPGDMAKNTR